MCPTCGQRCRLAAECPKRGGKAGQEAKVMMARDRVRKARQAKAKLTVAKGKAR